MVLPDAARRRLAAPARDRSAWLAKYEAPTVHTIPLDHQIWAKHHLALTTAIQDLGGIFDSAPPNWDEFSTTRSWVGTLVEASTTVYSILRSLEPFEPFNPEGARTLVAGVLVALDSAADAIERGLPSRRPNLPCGAWPDLNPQTSPTLLARTFGMTAEPVDDAGRFSPGRVFAGYAYQNGRLLQHVVPHMESLGLWPVQDVLAMVRIPALIVEADDPIVAFGALTAWIARRNPSDAPSPTAEAASAHLRGMEPARRQTMDRIDRAIAATMNDGIDLETKALTLAEVYRRLVEGPVRQHGWAMHCVAHGVWQAPPTLSTLRDRLVADGGWLSTFTAAAVLTDVRNGEAHETLSWDGYRRCFVDGESSIAFEDVLRAAVLAKSFAQGAEAAFTFFEALLVDPLDALPDAAQVGRSAGWRRAEAIFGTNGLNMVRAQLHSATAVVTIERLDIEDVNPCLQSLVNAQRLLPQVEMFEVKVADSAVPRVVVSADALDATHPVYSEAVADLSAMPLSVFLAANFDARSRVETPSVAARSAAWIAADDLLDALDGTLTWDERTYETFVRRVAIVRMAVASALPLVPEGHRNRLGALAVAIDNLESASPSTLPLGYGVAVDRLPAVHRIRAFWRAWGPVPRMPTVASQRGDRDPRFDVRPAVIKKDPIWSTL